VVGASVVGTTVVGISVVIISVVTTSVVITSVDVNSVETDSVVSVFVVTSILDVTSIVVEVSPQDTKKTTPKIKMSGKINFFIIKNPFISAKNLENLHNLQDII
jgi:hypothetical protein